MTLDQKRRWIIEGVSWLVTILVAIAFILPIVNNNIPFPFLEYNLFYAILGMTIFRYIVFWHIHPLTNVKLFKVILICCVPLSIFVLIEGIHSFVEYNDQVGLQEILGHLSPSRMSFFMTYIRVEYLLFGMMSFLGALLLIVKMIKSIWRQIKYN